MGMLSDCWWQQQADAEHQTSPQQQKLPDFARSCRPICRKQGTNEAPNLTCCERPCRKEMLCAQQHHTIKLHTCR